MKFKIVIMELIEAAITLTGSVLLSQEPLNSNITGNNDESENVIIIILL